MREQKVIRFWDYSHVDMILCLYALSRPGPGCCVPVEIVFNLAQRLADLSEPGMQTRILSHTKCIGCGLHEEKGNRDMTGCLISWD